MFFAEDALTISGWRGKYMTRALKRKNEQLTIDFYCRRRAMLLPKAVPMFRLEQQNTLIELVV